MRNIVICGLFVMVSALSVPAVASCVYNHASKEMSIDFNSNPTPWFHTNLHVKSGEHGCTDGKGGEAEIREVRKLTSDWWFCTVHVDDHGWINIYEESNRYHVVSKHADGSVEVECYKDK